MIFSTKNVVHQNRVYSFTGVIRGRGATGSIDPPLFQVRGPPMVLDPALLSGSLAIITAHTAQTDVQNVKFAELILCLSL